MKPLWPYFKASLRTISLPAVLSSIELPAGQHTYTPTGFDTREILTLSYDFFFFFVSRQLATLLDDDNATLFFISFRNSLAFVPSAYATCVCFTVSETKRGRWKNGPRGDLRRVIVTHPLTPRSKTSLPVKEWQSTPAQHSLRPPFYARFWRRPSAPACFFCVISLAVAYYNTERITISLFRGILLDDLFFFVVFDLVSDSIEILGSLDTLDSWAAVIQRYRSRDEHDLFLVSLWSEDYVGIEFLFQFLISGSTRREITLSLNYQDTELHRHPLSLLYS